MSRFLAQWLLPLALSGGFCAALLLLLGALPRRARPDPVSLYRASAAGLLLFLVPVRLPVLRLFHGCFSGLTLPLPALPAAPAADAAAQAAQAARDTAALLPDPGLLLDWLWLLGCCAGLLLACGPSISFRRMLRRECRAVGEPEPLAVLAQCRKELKIVREIPLLRCRGIGSPVLVGLLRPRILIDDAAYSPRELRFVLLHEVTHYKNGDLFWRHLALAVRILHWYHPLARLLAARIGPLGEAACDAAMTRPMAFEERRAYSETILALIGRSRGCPSVAAGFAQGREALQKRLSLILDAAPPSRARLLAGGAGLLSALLLGVTASALLAPASFDPAENARTAVIGGADGPTGILLADPRDGGRSKGLMEQLLSGCAFDPEGGAVWIEVPEQLPAGWKLKMTIHETQPGEQSAAQTWDLTFSKPGSFSFGVELGRLSRCNVKLMLCDESDAPLIEGERIWENPNRVSAPEGNSSGKLLRPVAGAREGSGFGWRYAGQDFHGGVDYPCDPGTPVRAAASGTVVSALYNTTGYGYSIVIDHGAGITTLYAHNSALLVEEGDWVEQGQKIAESGRSGNATGPVCHFELRLNGEYADPTPYFSEVE